MTHKKLASSSALRAIQVTTNNIGIPTETQKEEKKVRVIVIQRNIFSALNFIIYYKSKHNTN